MISNPASAGSPLSEKKQPRGAGRTFEVRANGGTNREKAPWPLDPAETRLVDVAIEVCDGRPSYFERNQSAIQPTAPGERG